MVKYFCTIWLKGYIKSGGFFYSWCASINFTYMPCMLKTKAKQNLLFPSGSDINCTQFNEQL